MSAVIAFIAGTLFLTVIPAQAIPRDFRIMTYNMQGMTAGANNKWTTDIQRLARDHQVIALQEVGNVPPSAHRTGRPAYQPDPGIPPVLEYTWQPGGARGTMYYIYFMETDPNGHRVNLAILTHDIADEIHVVAAGNQHGRPAFGVNFNGARDVYYTIHGNAGNGGGDTEALLGHIAGQLQGTRFRYVVLGDFNREPDRLRPPEGSHIYRTGEATQQGNHELNYTVAQLFNPYFAARRMNGASADHYAVELGPSGCVAPRDRRDASGSQSTTEACSNLPAEEILISAQLTKQQSLDRCLYDGGAGGKVWASTCPYRGYSEWDGYSDRWLRVGDGHIYSIKTGQCLDGNSEAVKLQPCADSPTQYWDLRQDRGIASLADDYLGKCLRANDKSDGNKGVHAYWYLNLGGCTGDHSMSWTKTLQLTVKNKYRNNSSEPDCVYGRLWDFTNPATVYGCPDLSNDPSHQFNNDKDFSRTWFWKGEGQGAGELTDDMWDTPAVGRGKGCLRPYLGDNSVAAENCGDSSSREWVLRPDNYVEYSGKCLRITKKDYKWWWNAAKYIYRPKLGACPTEKNADNVVTWKSPVETVKLPKEALPSG